MKNFLKSVLPVFFSAVMLLLTCCASGKEVRKVLDDPEMVSCIRMGELEKVKKMIRTKEEADSITKNGVPLIVLAAAEGKKDIAAYLLSCGADVNGADAKKNTALHVAAGKDHLQIAALLLEKGANINIPGNYGKTPLMEAARCGSGKCFALLLEKGADITIKDELGRTALMHCCMGKKDQVQMVKALLDKGAVREDSDSSGRMAVIYAAEKAHTESAKLLLDKYSDFSRDSLIGLAVMNGAIRGSDVKLAEYLLERKLPLNWDLFFSRQILRRLSVRGAYRLMARNGLIDAKRAPLLVAAKENNLPMVQFFISKGANILQKDEKGYTAYDLATDRMVISYLKKVRNRKYKEMENESAGRTPPLFRGRVLGN